jgi:predicted nucleic acid-binding Zn ribbon protein
MPLKDKISRRGSNTEPLKDLLQELFKEYRIEKKVGHATIQNQWHKIVGKAAANRTKQISFKNKVMFVEFTSASLKHEMSMKKSLLLQRIKEDFGADLVEEIVFM